MQVRSGVAAVTLTGLFFSPELVRAQAFAANPSVTAAGSYSSNAIIYHDPGRNPAIRLGPFVSLSPSLSLGYETPRTTQSFQAFGTIALPLTFATIIVPKGSEGAFGDESFTYDVRLAYANRIELTERTTLNLTLAGSAVPLNSTISGGDASTVPLEDTSSDFSYNLSLNGQESLSRQLSPESTLVQLANVTYSYPFNATPSRATTFNLRNSLAVTREWSKDSGTLTLSVGYTHFGLQEESSQAPANQVAQLSDEFLNTLIATWRRPLTPSLSSSVDLGVLQALSPQATGQIWQPTGGASLTYDLSVATASLSYTHTAQPNVLTATITVNDQVALRASLPLGETGLSLSGSAGYTYASPINFEIPQGSTHNIVADVEFAFVPPEIPKLSASIRGSYNRQTPVEDPLAGFTRLALIANVAFSFPSARSAAILRRVAPAYTPTPVLGSDSTPAPFVQPKPIELEEREATPLPATPAPR